MREEHSTFEERRTSRGVVLSLVSIGDAGHRCSFTREPNALLSLYADKARYRERGISSFDRELCSSSSDIMSSSRPRSPMLAAMLARYSLAYPGSVSNRDESGGIASSEKSRREGGRGSRIFLLLLPSPIDGILSAQFYDRCVHYGCPGEREGGSWQLYSHRPRLTGYYPPSLSFC